MTAALTPALAVDYLGTLWVGLGAAVVCDAAGRLLAGDAALADRVAMLATTVTAGEVMHAGSDDDVLHLARSESHIVAIAPGDGVLAALVACDLLSVLDDLAGC